MMIILTSIINWLMKDPGGLKLNKPLNEFLGRFFMYHIYLWNSKLKILLKTKLFLISFYICN
jgi:phosphatidylinositol glycan class Q protein